MMFLAKGVLMLKGGCILRMPCTLYLEPSACDEIMEPHKKTMQYFKQLCFLFKFISCKARLTRLSRIGYVVVIQSHLIKITVFSPPLFIYHLLTMHGDLHTGVDGVEAVESRRLDPA